MLGIGCITRMSISASGYGKRAFGPSTILLLSSRITMPGRAPHGRSAVFGVGIWSSAFRFLTKHGFSVRSPAPDGQGILRMGLGVAGRLLRRSLRLAGPFVAGEIPVLTYDSVDDTKSLLSISPNELRAQLAYLHSKGWNTLSPAEYVAQSAAPRDKRPRRSMLITFDDGFRNFHDQAVPLLLEFGYTATLFVATGFVGRQPSWLVRDKLVFPVPQQAGTDKCATT